jgi:hypothetical protein
MNNAQTMAVDWCITADRGSQHMSMRYTERLFEAGIEPSVAASATAMTMHWPRSSMATGKPGSVHCLLFRPSAEVEIAAFVSLRHSFQIQRKIAA